MNTKIAIVAIAVLSGQVAMGQIVSDFEDVALPAAGYVNASSDPSAAGIVSRGVLFPWNYNAAWGTAGGIAVSRIDDTTDYAALRYRHPYNSITGGGAGGSANYAVAYAFEPLEMNIPGDPVSVKLTNNSYGYYSLLHGSGFSKRFGGETGEDPDWFALTISGKDAGGELVGDPVSFYLADYRAAGSSAGYVVNSWQEVDLTGLAGARRLVFELSSSDSGAWGMNTPAYFAMDELTVLPEPAAMLLAAGGAILLARRRGGRA